MAARVGRRSFADAYPGLGRDNRGELPLPEPTDAAPGSEAKLRELERRAALGLALHHPDDAKGG